ncbi:MAG: DNA repair protein RecO [Planctomycetes bacterium]|nr:DNA repair protein RecO [Planctomycetota bacterium]
MSTPALVLRRFDYGETSQIGRFFTEEHGRLSALAKGIKRPNADLRGPIDLLVLADVEVRLRKKSDLHLLTRYRVVTGFPGIRKNLERWTAAFYVTEVLREGTRDLDPDPGLFAISVAAMQALEASPPQGAALVCAWFEIGWLRLAGFGPRFDTCANCGRDAPPSGPARFSPYLGGLVCRSCVASRSVRLVTLPASTRTALAAILSAAGPGAAARLDVPAEARRVLRKLLPEILQGVMEKELKAVPFVTP